MSIKSILMSVAGTAALTVGMPLTAMAANTVVVTPSNEQGWSTADTRTGGAVNFIADSTAPAGSGALQLTTDATTTAKAQYLHAASDTLASVTDFSYYTKQNSAPFPGAAPSYQIPVQLNGTSGFSTLVFEPYQNPLEGAVTPGVWQKWDVANGLFWSTRTVVCANGTVVGTPGGPASYTLSQIESLCPSAVSLGFGVNIGSNNPSYNVEADLVTYNGTAYNFEPTLTAASKDACKDGGWSTFNTPTFKNQGDCVSYIASNGKSNK